jgi:hypothetical protein
MTKEIVMKLVVFAVWPFVAVVGVAFVGLVMILAWTLIPFAKVTWEK